jgi:hypothetical protein
MQEPCKRAAWMSLLLGKWKIQCFPTMLFSGDFVKDKLETAATAPSGFEIAGALCYRP